MSTTIQIKRRVSGAVGPPATLAPGELAFNEVDYTLYYGAGNNSGLAAYVIAVARVGLDAPNDGQMYGMMSGSWGRAVSINGDTMAGGLTINGTTNLKGPLAISGGVTGNVNMAGGLTVGGVINANGGLVTASGNINVGQYGNLTVDGFTTLYAAIVNGNFAMNGTYVNVAHNLAVNETISLSSANAYKAGGGPWLATSDGRIKNVHRNYTIGLAQVERLQPVVYTYKGNDAAPGRTSPHHSVATSGKVLIGLVAQECEALFPEMVTKRSGFVDGVAVSDLRELDTGPLLYAMLNAIKELSRRLAKLEGAA